MGGIPPPASLLNTTPTTGEPRTIELVLLASADDPAVAPIPRRVTQRRRSYLRADHRRLPARLGPILPVAGYLLLALALPGHQRHRVHRATGPPSAASTSPWPPHPAVRRQRMPSPPPAWPWEPWRCSPRPPTTSLPTYTPPMSNADRERHEIVKDRQHWPAAASVRGSWRVVVQQCPEQSTRECFGFVLGEDLAGDVWMSIGPGFRRCLVGEEVEVVAPAVG